MDAFARTFAAAIVIALLGVLWWTTTRSRAFHWSGFRFSSRPLAGVSGMPQIALQGRLQLTPNHQLHLVRSTDELILLCTFPNGASVVSTKVVECVQKPASSPRGVDA